MAGGNPNSGAHTTFLTMSLIGSFLLGGLGGFVLGALSVERSIEIFRGALTEEQPADLSAPQLIDRPGFRLQHPSNWALSGNEGEDLDAFFEISSTAFCEVTLEFSDHPIEVEDRVRTWADYMADDFSSRREERFDRWGRYAGHGIRVRGREYGNRPRVEVFAHRGRNASFTVIEYCYEDDLGEAGPGFALIRQTFEFRDLAPSPSGAAAAEPAGDSP